ncbi:MAG: ImmA/IrrE family metallo-endopeptidase [Thiotrichales bacterium]|nr:ImmA/IrrE family metallo-endopeptidase [Thiotrichales bacterium]
MEIKLIQNEAEYEAAMARVSELMDLDPELNSPEGNELDVWVTLIKKFESEKVTPDFPSYIEAIKFFMDQRGFNQNDMTSYFGSKAKTSEILNGKKSLTLNMIRKLVNGLGIPANILLQDENKELNKRNIDWLAFPLKDMFKKHYFPSFEGKTLKDLKEVAEEEVTKFINQLPFSWELTKPEMRTAAHGNNDKEVSDYALWAWQIKVLVQCKEKEVSDFDKNLIDSHFLRRVARLSFMKKGPKLAEEFLASHGIYMIVEPHLEKTYLDGAAMMYHKHPVVALTLRYDRLDNFWFTLLHELAHISLGHVGEKTPFVFDSNLNPDDTTEKEKQANEAAFNAFGLQGAVKELMNVTEYAEVENLSKRFDLSPSIIIGQIRRFKNDHSIFTRKMGKVRYMFGM